MIQLEPLDTKARASLSAACCVQEPDTFSGGFLDFGGSEMSNVNWTNSILPTGKYPAHASTSHGCGLHAATPREHLADCFKPYQVSHLM